MKKKIAIIECLKVYEWLNRQIIDEIRSNFDVRLLLICGSRSDAMIWKKETLDDEKIIVNDELSEIKNTDTAQLNSALKDIENFEAKHNISFFADILQQSRGHFSNFVPYLVGRRIGSISYESAVYEAAKSIKLSEQIFSENDVCFLYVRPGGILSTILIYHARSLGIPVTFVRPSRYKSLFNWTCGPYSNGEYLADKMLKVNNREAAKYTVSHADSDVKKKLKGLKENRHFLLTLKTFLLIFLNYFLHTAHAWKKLQRYKGLGLSTQLELFFVQKWTLFWLSTKSKHIQPSSDKPYFLFLLPVEPEFTVNSLGRSFSDVKSLIWNIAIRIPVNHTLVIKEHAKFGYRKQSFYTDLLGLPNVTLADIHVPGAELVEKSSGVFSIAGTSPIEAGMVGIPSIIFSNSVEYDQLSFVLRCNSMKSLTASIFEHFLLDKWSAEDIVLETKKYLLALESISFTATNSVVFGGKGVTPVEVSKVIELLNDCISYQREKVDV